MAEPLSVQFPCEQHSAEFKNFLRQRPPYENLCLPEDKADQQAKEKLQKAVAAQKRFYRKYDSYTQHEWKLEREGFRQGDGSEDNPRVTVDYGDESVFCMDASGGAHEFWEITPMVSEPRPGDCIGY